MKSLKHWVKWGLLLTLLFSFIYRLGRITRFYTSPLPELLLKKKNYSVKHISSIWVTSLDDLTHRQVCSCQRLKLDLLQKNT